MGAVGRIGWLITVAALAGCSSGPPLCEDCPPEPPDPSAPPFAAWAWSDGCAPGLWSRDGECVAPATGAGIPADACAEGFVPMDDGCVPVLPQADCPVGRMALPGESRCRPVSDCGSDTWGSVPLDSDAIFVDPSFAGVSDGSAASPYTSVDTALAVAPSGAMVVLAAGSYPAITIEAPVRLWGRCPDLVEVGPITVSAAAELHRLHVAGGLTSIAVHAGPTLLDALWVSQSDEFAVHAFADTRLARSLLEDGRRGAVVEAALLVVEDCVVRDGPQAGIIARSPPGADASTLEVTRTFVDARGDIGIYARGAEATIRGSVVRGTEAFTGGGGFGVLFQPDIENGARPADGLVEGCYVTDSTAEGINVTHSLATIRHTVVRETRPAPDGRAGRGMIFRSSDSTIGISDVTVERSLVEDNYDAGIFVTGARARVADSIIRRTAPQLIDGRTGRGITGQHMPDEVPTSVEVVNSLVHDVYDVGIGALGVSLLVEGSRVTGVRPRQSDLYFGQGIAASPHDASGADSPPPEVIVRGSVVEDAYEAGVAVVGGSLVLEDSRIFDVHSSAHDGLIGIGFTAQGIPGMPDFPASASIRRVWIHQVRAAGMVAFESAMSIDESYVHDVRPSESGSQFGDGVVVTSFGAPSQVTLSQSRIENGARAGVALFGPSQASLAHNELICNLISLNGEGPYQLDDAGGNRCGCADVEETCKVVSSMLLPPDPLAP